MAARIVSLGRVSLGRPRAAREPAPPGVAEHALGRGAPERYVWPGASGRAYAHNVYSLIGCPPLPMASYVLVRRDAEGRRRALRAGVVQSEAPTLNLAHLRRAGALAGANEVHVCFDAASDADRRLIACDLRVGLFGSLAASAGPEPANA
jgi:hypothetical protein